MTEELQPWLPFDFVKEEKDKDQREQDQKQREIQEAIAQLPYFPEPKNDHEKLFNLQYEYKHGRQAALGEMYELTVEVCYKILHHLCKNTKIKTIRWLPYVDRQIKAQDAATYFIEQYLKRPDFMRHRSILSYLFSRVAKELYYTRKVDKIVEFVDFDTMIEEDEDYGNPDDWD